jgi:hypothetical protein
MTLFFDDDGSKYQAAEELLALRAASFSAYALAASLTQAPSSCAF